MKRTTLSLLFYIKRTKLLKNGNAPLYLKITINVELSLKRSIPVELWSATKGHARSKSKTAILINEFIESTKVILYNHLKELREDGKDINPLTLKNAYLGIEENKVKVLEFFKTHNEQIKSLVGKSYSYETFKKYNTSLNHTKNFIKKYYHVEDINFKEVTHKFLCDYEYYFKSEKQCNHNTTMKYIKNFKKIINIGLANEWIKKDPYINFEIKFKKVERGFLTEDDLDKIISKKFEIERLEQVKDCFLFSCFTGLAYADLKRLTIDNIFIAIEIVFCHKSIFHSIVCGSIHFSRKNIGICSRNL